MWQYLVKLHTHLPCDPAIPHLGICPKYVTTNIKRHLYAQGYSLQYYLQKLETGPMPISWELAK